MKVHAHNESQHQMLLTAISSHQANINELYIDYHNGDKKLNKRIMAILKGGEQIATGLKMHMEDTQDMDSEIEKGRQAIMELERQKESRRGFRRQAINVIIGIATTGIVLWVINQVIKGF